MKAKHTFVGKVFNEYLNEFQKDWSNIAVVRVHGRLYGQSCTVQSIAAVHKHHINYRLHALRLVYFLFFR